MSNLLDQPGIHAEVFKDSPKANAFLTQIWRVAFGEASLSSPPDARRFESWLDEVIQEAREKGPVT